MNKGLEWLFFELGNIWVSRLPFHISQYFIDPEYDYFFYFVNNDIGIYFFGNNIF